MHVSPPQDIAGYEYAIPTSTASIAADAASGAGDPMPPAALRQHVRKPLLLRSADGFSWHRVTSLEALGALCKSLEAAGERVRLVNGHTSSGIYGAQALCPPSLCPSHPQFIPPTHTCTCGRPL